MAGRDNVAWDTWVWLGDTCPPEVAMSRVMSRGKESGLEVKTAGVETAEDTEEGKKPDFSECRL